MEHVAVNPWAALAYLIAGVCFILALRGLSSPATSQRGNRYGMLGMTIAVVTTLLTHVPVQIDDFPQGNTTWGSTGSRRFRSLLRSASARSSASLRRNASR
jgi:hypothetical protein